MKKLTLALLLIGVVFPILCIAQKSETSFSIGKWLSENTWGKDSSWFWTMVQAIGTVLTFGALIFQLRKINSNLQHDAYSRTIEDYSQMVNQFLVKPELSSFFYEGIKEFEDLTEEEKDFYNYISLSMTLFERIYLLSKKGSLEPEIWKSWEHWLIIGWFRLKLFETYWRTEREFFTKSFQEFVDNKLKEFKSINPKEQKTENKKYSKIMKPTHSELIRYG